MSESDTPREAYEAMERVRIGKSSWLLELENLCISVRRREEELTAARAETDHYIDVAQKATEDLIAVTKQRDRLAEALERIVWEEGSPMSLRVRSTKSIAQEALQSLTANADGLGRRTLDADSK